MSANIETYVRKTESDYKYSKNMTIETKRSGVDIGKDPEGGTPTPVPSTHTYSTTEQVVGTWLDGKPVYEVTLTGKIKDGSVNTSSLNIETMITTSCIAFNDANVGFRHVPFSYGPNNSGGWCAGYDMGRTHISWQFGDAFLSYFPNYRIILRYTKTTDVAPV